MPPMEAEQMSVVMLGHVDHGKSTVIGRLLADMRALPTGKLEQVKATCARHARPFEYAFLLDALKDEQAQGITIDAARCFFKTATRRYLVFDAPGHVEFLKNMITGAARAEAAFLVIDAREGVQENSKRHGYIASMLGLKQLSVLINKMDLVNFDAGVFAAIRREYAAFLARLNVAPVSFIPVSALRGENIATRSTAMPWHEGPCVLDQFDAFEPEPPDTEAPLRFPVQDIYKFTELNDERRIVAGTVETGRVRAGDEVVFYPSGQRTRIARVEAFNTPPRTAAEAGEAAGFTLEAPLYVRPGELMARAADPAPRVGTRFRANLFWMGRAPMIQGKRYKLKIGAARAPMKLVSVLNVLDASELTSETNKRQVDRHDVAECVLEAQRPVAFDCVRDVRATGRFVVVDNYEIAAAGIVLEKLPDEDSTLEDHVTRREFAWEGGGVTAGERAAAYGHGAKWVVFTGESPDRVDRFARALEQHLFRGGFKAYFLRMANVLRGLDADIVAESDVRDEHIRRLGELARILTDSGQIFITPLPGADAEDLRALELLNKPNEILVVNVGEDRFGRFRPHLSLPAGADVEAGVLAVCSLLKQKRVILEYQI